MTVFGYTFNRLITWLPGMKFSPTYFSHKLKHRFSTSTIAFGLLLFLCLIFFSAKSKSANEIVIPINNWASQQVVSHAIGQLISERGYEVRYQAISANDQWGAIQRGFVHFQLEVWQASMAEHFDMMVAARQIADLGIHDAVGREDWWYPIYVEKDCPQLPNWQALNECFELFRDNSELGIYYSGPWNFGDADIIRALQLKFEIRRFNRASDIWQVLNRANKEVKPVLVLNWSPNWTDVEMKGRFIEFPKYEPECEYDPEWGINPKMVKDCGNPRGGWIKKAAWVGLEKYDPCVFQFLQVVNFSNDMLARASYLYDVEGLPAKEAGSKWLRLYEGKVSTWRQSLLSGQCR